MIALAARDEMTPAGLADLYKILTRQLQRGFDRFRPARYKVNVVKVARGALLQEIGQVFRCLRGKK